MTIETSAVDDATIITINQPDTRNGLDLENIDILSDAIGSAADDPEMRFLIVRGVPDWFCIGGSGRFMEHILEQPEKGREGLSKRVQKIVLELLNSPLLTVSVLDGLAAGAGADMVLASDLVLATERARFSFLYSKLGLVPDTGMRLLEWRMRGRGLLAFAESKILKAEQLAELGLAEPCNDLADDKSLVKSLRRRFRHDRRAFAECKALRNEEQFATIEADLDRAAKRQAWLLGRPETKSRLLHSAAAQRAGV